MMYPLTLNTDRIMLTASDYRPGKNGLTVDDLRAIYRSTEGSTLRNRKTSTSNDMDCFETVQCGEQEVVLEGEDEKSPTTGPERVQKLKDEIVELSRTSLKLDMKIIKYMLLGIVCIVIFGAVIGFLNHGFDEYNSIKASLNRKLATERGVVKLCQENKEITNNENFAKECAKSIEIVEKIGHQPGFTVAVFNALFIHLGEDILWGTVFRFVCSTEESCKRGLEVIFTGFHWFIVGIIVGAMVCLFFVFRMTRKTLKASRLTKDVLDSKENNKKYTEDVSKVNSRVV